MGLQQPPTPKLKSFTLADGTRPIADLQISRHKTLNVKLSDAALLRLPTN